MADVNAALGEGVARGSIVDGPMAGDLMSVPIYFFGFDAKEELE